MAFDELLDVDVVVVVDVRELVGVTDVAAVVVDDVGVKVGKVVLLVVLVAV